MLTVTGSLVTSSFDAGFGFSQPNIATNINVQMAEVFILAMSVIAPNIVADQIFFVAVFAFGYLVAFGELAPVESLLWRQLTRPAAQRTGVIQSGAQCIANEFGAVW